MLDFKCGYLPSGMLVSESFLRINFQFSTVCKYFKNSQAVICMIYLIKSFREGVSPYFFSNESDFVVIVFIEGFEVFSRVVQAVMSYSSAVHKFYKGDGV